MGLQINFDIKVSAWPVHFVFFFAAGRPMNIVWMLSVGPDFIANFLGALGQTPPAIASLGPPPIARASFRIRTGFYQRPAKLGSRKRRIGVL
jgi:hypothetical protein